jgi:hypothetical protein
MSKVSRLAFVVLLCSPWLFAQAGQASMAVQPPKVKQGEQVSIQITVSPAPNVGGWIDPVIAPEDNSNRVDGVHMYLQAGQTTIGVSMNIPVDAKLGNWKVMQVSFRPESSSGKDLKITGNVAFEVIKRETVLPTSADVQVK